MMETGDSDDSLLELAGVVLRQAGYTVLPVDAAGLHLLMAEDDINIVAVAALLVPERILQVEPAVSRALTERLVAANVPQKKWDGYVVLLCAQSADDSQTEALSELANNLRQLRRVVRVGIEPTRADVARALRPLLPLPAPTLEQQLADPLVSLTTMLLRDGLDPAAVRAAMDAFKLEVITMHPDETSHVADNEPVGPGQEYQEDE